MYQNRFLPSMQSSERRCDGYHRAHDVCRGEGVLSNVSRLPHPHAGPRGHGPHVGQPCQLLLSYSNDAYGHHAESGASGFYQILPLGHRCHTHRQHGIR